VDRRWRGRASAAARDSFVGFLNSASPDVFADRLRAFHQGLKETGFVEGDNVAIVYRWAENQFDRLPELAADLVQRRVAAIAVNTCQPKLPRRLSGGADMAIYECTH
jgi:hypothetical protein